MRNKDRIGPLGSRVLRLWAGNHKMSLIGLLLSVVKAGEVPESIDDLTLVQRLEKAYPGA
jgi:hypothetical protein